MIFDVAIAAFPNKPSAQVEQWLNLFQQSLPDQAEDSVAFFEYLLGQRLISPIEYEEAVSSSELNVGGESLAVEFGEQYGWLEEDSFDESEDMWQHGSAQSESDAVDDNSLGFLGSPPKPTPDPLATNPAVGESTFGQTSECGQDVDGFSMVRPLGQGAMGEVHIAKDLLLKRKVALKWIKEDNIDNQARMRFVREVLITAQLDHPNIVPVYSMEKTQRGDMAYAMKWIRGRTLEEIVLECREATRIGTDLKEMSLSERIEVFLKVCDAVHYGHVKGIIHRDLKPSNIMVGPFGEVVVMDWGIARQIGVPDPVDVQRQKKVVENGSNDPEVELDVSDLNPDVNTTQDGSVIGTLAYISPEQARGAVDELTGASDQYALGLILFELITLQRAIPNGKAMDMLRRARRGMIAPVVHFRPKTEIRPEMQAIIEKSTRNSPGGRYATVDELAEDIRRFLRNEPVLAMSDTPLMKLTRWVSNHRLQALALFAALFISALISNIYNLHLQQQERAAAQLRETEQREAAELRAKRIGELLGLVNTQGHRIDRSLLQQQAQLRSLASAAQTRLRMTAEGEVKELSKLVYRNADYSADQTAPKDLVFSERYGKKISVEHPVVKLAPGVDWTPEIATQARQMTSLIAEFQQAFAGEKLDVSDPTSLPKIRQMITSGGSDLVWAFVATSTGIHTAYPGKGDYDPSYDPRQRPWYTGTPENGQPSCGTPYEDAQGQGLIMPCTVSIFDSPAADPGPRIGVVGIELSLRTVSEQMLTIEGLSQTTVPMLLNNEGVIKILGEGAEDEEARLALEGTYPNQRVLRALRNGHSGYELDNRNDRVAFYTTLDVSGWHYIVEGQASELIPRLDH